MKNGIYFIAGLPKKQLNSDELYLDLHLAKSIPQFDYITEETSFDKFDTKRKLCGFKRELIFSARVSLGKYASYKNIEVAVNRAKEAVAKKISKIPTKDPAEIEYELTKEIEEELK